MVSPFLGVGCVVVDCGGVEKRLGGLEVAMARLKWRGWSAASVTTSSPSEERNPTNETSKEKCAGIYKSPKL